MQATAFRMRMRVGHRVTSVTSMAIDQRTTRTFVRRGALIRMVFSPSPAQLAQIRAESAAAPTYIDAKVKKVKKIDGSGLSCFFLMMLAGLAWLGIEAVPATVTALRRRISTFFRTRDAATTIITQSGETLQDAAEREGSSLKRMAAELLKDGTEDGMGGSEHAAAVCT